MEEDGIRLTSTCPKKIIKRRLHSPLPVESECGGRRPRKENKGKQEQKR